ncbi:hypothetical protein PYCCODRAFT_1400934 [Trametes coccinea BRFM310]|uniref:Protection of telomeres protein 1 n=1 Tax=Trametes coccinea (strain BRFM310) TaxID=1353009 RepID=A0A1Y2J572_TRAC3|nr:hypothetical protein PYCCODRAFT_1400934 [Trametes coccinea BRFM310]
MKRPAEAEPAASSKRARPDPQTVEALFKPDQRKKAADICRKGTDGTGYIEGKVFEKGSIAGDCWVFLLTAELGFRVQVSLAGNCSKYFAELPIAVGALVRITTRGLALEDLEGPKKALMLAKRFVWSEGVTIHVRNSKTGESLVDTWADSRLPPSPSTQMPHTAEPHNESEPTDSAPPFPMNTTAGQSHDATKKSTNGAISSDSLQPEVSTSTGAVQAVPVPEDAGDPPEDPHNPQSLPSPPPETGEGHTAHKPDSFPTTAPHIPTSSGDHTHGTAPLEELQNPATEGGRTVVRASNEAKAGPSKKTKNPKKLRHDRDRKLKQLRRAGKLGPSPEANVPNAQSREPSADDGEDYYWDAADTLPEDAFLENPEPEVATAERPAKSPSVAPEVKAEVGPDNAGREGAAAAPSGHVQVIASTDDPWESLRMGCVSGLVVYTPLAQLTAAPHMRNIMGVVESTGVIKPTKNGEYTVRLCIYDPTNIGTAGLSVVLFDKSERGLPRPDAGDILMLRTVQIKDFNGPCATGPSYKGWQWAVFHVKTGRMLSAPLDTCAMRYFKAEESEVKFCLRLGDWWREISSNAADFEVSFAHKSRYVRPHKAIADAEHEEYFDCTVEVLHGFRHENGVYTVFVTDYTRNPHVSPTQGEWCPPRLAPYVLRIEMWDSSAEVGPAMQAGEYYSIRNLRTKISSGGYLEGKMQEGEKITKLDEDQLEDQPRLAELLKRKVEWEAEMNASGGVHEFPHQLIGEAEENRHFKCTVEVVHISPKDDFTYLYVTDYTARTDLVPVAAHIAPSALADRVVRIELRDAQVDTARNLEAGDYIAIRNLRLRPSAGGPLLSGRLGGDQRLITKLNAKASGNAELRALLRRKEEWEAAQTRPKREGKRTAARAARHAAAEDASSAVRSRPRKGTPGQHFGSLQEVQASTACPAVFRVRARPVDFFPDDLRDCVVLRCTSCNETRVQLLPKTRRRCTRCDDAMDDETAVRAFFELWLRLADDEGTTLDVSVADERCSVLRDLSPEDVYEDEDAFAMLVARVRPLLGGLLDVRDGEAKRRPVGRDEEGGGAPWVDLTIGSWLPAGEEDTPDARAYVVLKHALCEDE